MRSSATFRIAAKDSRGTYVVEISAEMLHEGHFFFVVDGVSSGRIQALLDQAVTTMIFPRVNCVTFASYDHFEESTSSSGWTIDTHV